MIEKIKEEYNTKIKEYKNQIVLKTYDKSVLLYTDLFQHSINLKRLRTESSFLMYIYPEGSDLYGKAFYGIEPNEWEDIRLNYYINHNIDEVKDIDYLENLTSDYIYLNEYYTDSEKESRSLQSSLNRTKTKVYDYSYSNDWSLFITLTFDDSKLIETYGKDATDYNTCVKALHVFNTILRRDYPDTQYIGVPELHHTYYDVVTHKPVIYQGHELKDFTYKMLCNKVNTTQEEREIIKKIELGQYKRRFHFHFLFNNFPTSQLQDSGKKDKKGRIIYNLINYKVGFTTATKVENIEASQYYITKYITKDLVGVAKYKKRYWNSRNLETCKEYEYLYDDKDMDQLIKLVEPNKVSSKTINVKSHNYENTIKSYVIKNEKIVMDQILFDMLKPCFKIIDIEGIADLKKVEEIAKQESGNGFIFFNYDYDKYVAECGNFAHMCEIFSFNNNKTNGPTWTNVGARRVFTLFNLV
jgi:hypothetical protein